MGDAAEFKIQDVGDCQNHSPTEMSIYGPKFLVRIIPIFTQKQSNLNPDFVQN